MDPPDIMKLVLEEEVLEKKEKKKNVHLQPISKKNDEIIGNNDFTVLGFKDQNAIMWTNLTYFLCILLALVFIFKYFSK